MKDLTLKSLIYCHYYDYHRHYSSLAVTSGRKVADLVTLTEMLKQQATEILLFFY